jgi:hypothetical protein
MGCCSNSGAGKTVIIHYKGVKEAATKTLQMPSTYDGLVKKTREEIEELNLVGISFKLASGGSEEVASEA